MHAHPVPADPGLFAYGLALAGLSAATAYGWAAARLLRRGDVWSRWRTISFLAGSAGVAWIAVSPLPGEPFTAHMMEHLVLGMAAPLLLVLARPFTLALRVLPPDTARRRLLALAHSRPAAWAVFPPVAALLDLGGLWLLYRTELFAAVQHRPLRHAVMHGHVLAAGLLFTFSVCQLDPVRRRSGLPLRGATLLAAGAAHAVLAKTLYAAPPPGTAFTAGDVRTGAQIMYYGGDVVEAALAVVLAASWFQAAGRARHRRSRTNLLQPASPETGP
ncbi:cytochrome c oxidase assembly protein [Streptomyces sp. DH8]|uniref:cytochrome c oxidase assembly protein n=1 Tax=Streptomyces sp. DH8 TaxID=2857008 RepID=UPI001E378F61|nr:cytochrome c oxidase assembly protein [Streptomyces sp. DH8]